MTHRIQLAFEELTQQLLIPVLENPRIHTVIEYAASEEKATMTVQYGGPEADITKTGDELPLAVLKSAASEMTYSRRENADLPNQILLSIRE